MSSDRTRELVLPLAILVSVAVGAVLGTVFVRTGGSATTAAASQGDSKELVDVLQALRAEITLLREARNDLSARPAASERIEVSPTEGTSKSDVVAELHAATQELATAVETLRSAVARPGGDPSRLILPPTPRDPQLVDAVASRERNENENEFMLWTPQQVLTKFGKPDGVNGGQWGPSWDYLTENYELTFRFQNGTVYQIVSQKQK